MLNKFKKEKYFYQCFIFSLILGCFLHFTYNLSNQNNIIGYFSPVNESVWEHGKLVVFPILFFSIYYLIKHSFKVNNYFIALSLSILTSIISIVGLFYFYYFFTHKSYFILDIIIFTFSCYVASKMFFLIINQSSLFFISQILGFILTCLLLYCIFKWTYNIPELFFFKEISSFHEF